MTEILEIGADGAFDLDACESVSSSKPIQKSSTASRVVTEKNTEPQKGQLEVLLSQLAINSFKVVENKGKSSLIVLIRLPGDETLSNIQYDANDSEKFLDVFTTPAGAVAEDGETGEKKKYRVPLPKQVTGINGQQQYIVFNKNSMSCNSQQLDSCINLVINVPYTKA